MEGLFAVEDIKRDDGRKGEKRAGRVERQRLQGVVVLTRNGSDGCAHC